MKYRITFSSTRYKDNGESFTQWTSTCCDILERSNNHDDQVLGYLVRLGNTMADAAKAAHDQDREPEQKLLLIRLGLEMKLQTLIEKMPLSISTGGKHRSDTPTTFLMLEC